MTKATPETLARLQKNQYLMLQRCKSQARAISKLLGTVECEAEVNQIKQPTKERLWITVAEMHTELIHGHRDHPLSVEVIVRKMAERVQALVAWYDQQEAERVTELATLRAENRELKRQMKELAK